jgi:molybdenum cofactor synthesis domain-containing protein
MAEYDLLKKNELKFTGLTLVDVNLNSIADAMAAVLELDRSEVFVTDVLPGVLTLDVLRATIYPHQILGKQDAMLAALAAIPGVTVPADVTITSEGMLGWIAADAEAAGAAMARAEGMIDEVRARLAKRAMIFATGDEVVAGDIEDTNSPAIAARLKAEGYAATFGGKLRDDVDLIAGKLRRAVLDGYTVIITTGGVGAERKDCTIEAVQQLDPAAATPFIVTFEQGKGRHFKPGVRVAVGTFGDALLISLPGPNDEVCASLPIISDILAKRPSNAIAAEAIAANLRGLLRQKMARWHGTAETAG